MADWAAQRRDMVERQLLRRGIRDERVIAAMGEVPREEFIPLAYRESSYCDEPVSIGHGQTISQPYMVALMAACLELRGGEKLLEVGAGCGYHAAVLGRLAGSVISLELVPELAAAARDNLARAGLDANVRVIRADGSPGYAAEAPYDGISVAAAAPGLPPGLLEQLADPGLLVIPVGSWSEQELCVWRKRQGEISTRVATLCRFVPLLGREGWTDQGGGHD